MTLIQFAEVKVQQFENDLLEAKQDDELIQITINKLNNKKHDYWHQIMEKLQEFIEPSYHDHAYNDLSEYHTKFKGLLEGFVHKQQ